ncbi:MAG: RNA-directed DNA polymerase [Azoarcus sp.]|jgi:retron-type reverse transcriptase|nr:RNA-directed DNA polymerase [Azoarcus sp.]
MPHADAKPLSQLSREALYDRVRRSAKDAVTLQEMQRLGYWPADTDSPVLEAALIQREAELVRSLGELGAQLARIDNPKAALRDMHKARKAKAKARREATRRQKAQQRYERAQHWHQRRAREILYLGQHVSNSLPHLEYDADKLAGHALPAPQDSLALAQAMGLELGELRFLAYERRVSRTCHYQRFEIAKKTGGVRVISAPMPRLKRAQYWILDNILAKAPVHPAAHGFLPGRSIRSNAAPHVGRAVVVNLDLKNFFPSIHYPRIKGVFRELGYSGQIATLLGLLCTETPVDEILIDGERCYVANGPRHLPQGAPTSPMLTNLLCRRLDARLDGIARKLGFDYTRYADDLSFSAAEAAQKHVGKLLWRVRRIVAEEGFTPHPDKQHVMRRQQRQHVTGLTVNDKLSIDRATFRRFRAALHQVETSGPRGKHWNGNPDVLAALEGYARFIHMVDPARGAPCLQRLHALRRLDATRDAERPAARRAPRGFRQNAAAGHAPWPNWWRPAAPPAPVLERTAEQIAGEKREQAQQSAPAVPFISLAPQEQAVAQQTGSPPEQPDPKHFIATLCLQMACALAVVPLATPRLGLLPAIVALVIQIVRKHTSWKLFFALFAIALGIENIA